MDKYDGLGTLRPYLYTPCIGILKMAVERAYPMHVDWPLTFEIWHLFQYGLLIHSASKGWTEMTNYLRSPDWTEMTKHLICPGKIQPLGQRQDVKGLDRAVFYVCVRGFEEIFPILLTLGADIHGEHLKLSARHGYFTLLHKILDLQSKNVNGKIYYSYIHAALMLAAKWGHIDIVRLLLNHRQASGMTFSLDVSREQINARPPIVSAVAMEDEKMFHLLLHHGATLQTAETGGLAVQVAKEEGLDSMLALLEQHNALGPYVDFPSVDSTSVVVAPYQSPFFRCALEPGYGRFPDDGDDIGMRL